MALVSLVRQRKIAADRYAVPSEFLDASSISRFEESRNRREHGGCGCVVPSRG